MDYFSQLIWQRILRVIYGAIVQATKNAAIEDQLRFVAVTQSRLNTPHSRIMYNRTRYAEME